MLAQEKHFYDQDQGKAQSQIISISQIISSRHCSNAVNAEELEHNIAPEPARTDSSEQSQPVEPAMEHHEHQKQDQDHSRSEMKLQEGVEEERKPLEEPDWASVAYRCVPPLADEAIDHRLAKNQAEPEE